MLEHPEGIDIINLFFVQSYKLSAYALKYKMWKKA